MPEVISWDDAMRSAGGVAGAMITIYQDACAELRTRWREDLVEGDFSEGSLPIWVKLRGRRVFEVDLNIEPERITIRGRWLVPKSKLHPSWFDRLLGRAAPIAVK